MCVFVIYTSLRHLFNFTLYWSLKVRYNFTGIINNYILIVVAVSVGRRVCAHMCRQKAHKHCYGFYPATVVTLPF